MVDRYSAYKAMSWVKDGLILLAFCWSHVRRDFIRVGKGWPKLKTWALEWLRRIRGLYRLNESRLAAERGSVAFGDSRRLPASGRGRDENRDGDGTGPGRSRDHLAGGLWKAWRRIGRG